MKISLTLIIALFSMAVSNAQTTYKNPVYGSDFPDPTVQRAPDGTFYAYATGCRCRKSSNLINWTNVSGVISRPTWNDSVKADGTTDHYSLWAADANYVDGRYVLYYASALWGNGTRTGIGVATGATPEKFTDVGKMFRSEEIGVHNSIDPVYIEEFDKKYLAWGSFHDIYIAELTDDALAVKDFKKKTKIAGGAFEGAMLYKRGNYYYLFASVGSCCEGGNSTYRVVVGRSTKLTGPYLNKQGGDMKNNNYTTILTGNDRWRGPGHNSEIITDDNGDDWMLYHSYDSNNDFQGRLMLLDKITWSADGWPSINDGHPSSDAMPAPVFYSGEGANITYKFQNMDLMKSGWKGWTVEKSEDIDMNSGKGSAFMPLGYAKTEGSFDASQTIKGVEEGIYEMSLNDFATEGGVELYVNRVATPALNPAEENLVAPASETVISSNFLRGRFSQKVYGLATDGKLTIGMRTKGSLTSGERFYAGNIKVVFRGKNVEAVQNVLQAYYDMADAVSSDNAPFYKGYRESIAQYKQDAEAAEDGEVKYQALKKVSLTLDSIDASKAAYSALSEKYKSMQQDIDDAQKGGYCSEEAVAILAEAAQVLADMSYPDGKVEELIQRMSTAVHEMQYSYQKGDGTRDNPYVISRPEQLDHMRDVLVKEQMVYFEMDSDVDMEGFVWKQLNTSENNYRNWFTLDGKGHIIFNLTPDGSKYYPSFAGTLCGEVRNVGFVNAKVEATTSGSGIICGYMGHSTFKDEEGNMFPVIVENCYLTGSIVSKGYVGAVGGTLNSSPITIRNCYSAVNILGNGGSANYSGGLVGRVRTELSIERCYAAGEVSSPIAGGIVAGGQNSSTPVSTYDNVIAWNKSVDGNTALPFGTTATGDILMDTYTFAETTINGEPNPEGKSHAELQKVAEAWGEPWYKDPSAGNGYPILQWQYDRGDYRDLCGFEGETSIDNVTSEVRTDAEPMIHDLMGRRIAHPSKGIYIINGKKTIIR